MRSALLGLALLLPGMAFAQDAEPEIRDEIIVKGQRLEGGDAAMSAFLSGDYETAEIEFERNYRIIKRGRTDIEFAARDAVTGQLNAVGSEIVTAGSQNSPGQIQSAPSLSSVPNGIRSSREDGAVLSGRDLGFQMYMAGLSELQQLKVDEAEDSFKRAVTLNSRLYDARMRWALLRLGKGDVAFARKQYGYITKASERCKDCDQREELDLVVATLGPILAKYR